MYEFQNHVEQIVSSIIDETLIKDDGKQYSLNFAVLVTSKSGPSSLTQEFANRIILPKEVVDKFKIEIGESQPFYQNISNDEKIYAYCVICMRKDFAKHFKAIN